MLLLQDHAHKSYKKQQNGLNIGCILAAQIASRNSQIT